MFHSHPQTRIGTVHKRSSFPPALCQPMLHNAVWSERGANWWSFLLAIYCYEKNPSFHDLL